MARKQPKPNYVWPAHYAMFHTHINRAHKRGDDQPLFIAVKGPIEECPQCRPKPKQEVTK